MLLFWRYVWCYSGAIYGVILELYMLFFWSYLIMKLLWSYIHYYSGALYAVFQEQYNFPMLFWSEQYIIIMKFLCSYICCFAVILKLFNI